MRKGNGEGATVEWLNGEREVNIDGLSGRRDVGWDSGGGAGRRGSVGFNGIVELEELGGSAKVLVDGIGMIGCGLRGKGCWEGKCGGNENRNGDEGGSHKVIGVVVSQVV